MRIVYKFRSSLLEQFFKSFFSFGKFTGKHSHSQWRTATALHHECFPWNFSKFSEQLFCRIPVDSCFCKRPLFWILAYSPNLFPFMTVNLAILPSVCHEFSCELLLNMENINYLVCVAFTLSYLRTWNNNVRLTQIATRLLFETQVLTRRLIELHLTTRKLLYLQLTACKLLNLQLRDSQLTNSHLRSLLSAALPCPCPLLIQQRFHMRCSSNRAHP